jgi:aminoglycoside 6'-N-acetyltransferase
MNLRRATIADLALLRSWDLKPHVVAASGQDGLTDWATELRRTVSWAELLIAEVDGRPIGILQIIDPAQEDTHYWGDVAPNLRAIDIWIGEETDLGRGFGSAMMGLALDRCFGDSNVEAVLIDPLESNTRAHRFYERLGFRRVERRCFGPDDCVVYRLDRTHWQSLEAVR